jgi:hypothetical protein
MPVGDCVRLAVDVWFPVERTAVEGTVDSHAGDPLSPCQGPREPGPETDTTAAAGDLFNRAEFALVLVDARGPGASFGTGTGELGEREIKDYGELIGQVAAQPWSNGRVGISRLSESGGRTCSWSGLHSRRSPRLSSCRRSVRENSCSAVTSRSRALGSPGAWSESSDRVDIETISVSVSAVVPKLLDGRHGVVGLRCYQETCFQPSPGSGERAPF